MSHPDREYLEKYLQPLVGATIESVGAAEDPEGWSPWPVLTVRTAGGKTIDLEIGCDEEGNGPGFIHGLR